VSGDGREPTLAEQLEQFSTRQYSPFDPKTGEGLERDDEQPDYRATIADEYVAPSARATHDYGLLFRADHETLGDGMCRQARLHARALADHIPVLLASIHSRVRRDGMSFGNAGDDMLEDVVFEEIGPLRRTLIRNFVAALYHTQIHSPSGLTSLLVPEHTRSIIGASERLLSRSAVYVPWERSTVSQGAIESLNKLGQVWLQCTRNRDVFVAAGLEPSRVRLIYPAYDPKGPVAQIPERSSAVPPGKRFYNIGKWEPRKAQHRIVGAFLKAYGPRDAAGLTIKTTYFGKWSDYPPYAESIRVWLEDPEVRARGWTADNVGTRVAIYDKTFTEEQITLLHERHNIYVSASHAEGWDYPAFDAKTAGNALVHVGFGGTEDYADADHGDLRLPFRLAPVHPQYEWEPHARWADYDLSLLVEYLQAASPPAERRPRPDLARLYGMEAAGRVMLDAVRELVPPEEWNAAESSWKKESSHAG
jgi:hypothetical protein